jgi:hypothetical protein
MIRRFVTALTPAIQGTAAYCERHRRHKWLLRLLAVIASRAAYGRDWRRQLNRNLTIGYQRHGLD